MRPLSLNFALCLFTSTIFSMGYTYGQSNSALSTALIIGSEASGETLYLCRASLFGKQVVGITKVGTNQCTSIYNGNLHFVNQYIVPSQSEFGHYIWSNTIDKAIKVGQDTNGNPVFICQSTINGHLVPGITRPGYNYCTVVYQNKAVIMSITNFLSRM